METYIVGERIEIHLLDHLRILIGGNEVPLIDDGSDTALTTGTYLGTDASVLATYLAIYPEKHYLPRTEQLLGLDNFAGAVESLVRYGIAVRNGDCLSLAPHCQTDLQALRRADREGASLRELRQVLNKATQVGVLSDFDAAWAVEARDKIVRVERRVTQRLLRRLDGLRRKRTARRTVATPAAAIARIAGPRRTSPSFGPVLYGRTTLIEQLLQTICARSNRHVRSSPSWLTLIGPLGIGKSVLLTELGAQVACRRVVSVPLKHVEQTEGVLDRIASSLGIGGHETIREAQSLETLIARQLASTPTLLLLDDCDNLKPLDLLLILRLLVRTETFVVATARVPLRVPGEVLFRVPRLSVPTPEEILAWTPQQALYESPAVALFVHAAERDGGKYQLSQEALPLVREILDLTSGNPNLIRLAGQMAATRPLPWVMMSLQAGQKFAAMDQAESIIDGIVSSALTRVSTRVREVWSVLSLFAGPFDHAAAAAALGTENVQDYLDLLIDSNLVEEVRVEIYRVPRSYRAYGASLLNTEHQALVLGLIAAHYAQFTRTNFRNDLLIDRQAESILGILSAVTGTPDPAVQESIARISTAMYFYWSRHGKFEEAAQSLTSATQLTAFEQLPASLRTSVLGNLGTAHMQAGRFDDALHYFAPALELARTNQETARLGALLDNKAIILARRGQHQESLLCNDEALLVYRQLGEPDRLACALGNAGSAYLMAQRWDDALALSDEMFEIACSIGDAGARQVSLIHRAEALCGLGRFIESQESAIQAAVLSEQDNAFSSVADAIAILGIIMGRLGDMARAQYLLGTALRFFHSTGEAISPRIQQEADCLGIPKSSATISTDIVREELRRILRTLHE